MRRAAAVGLVAMMAASPAGAEGVRLVGTFPADSSDVAMQRSIAVGGFGGRGGIETGIALDRALTRPGIDGLVHFIVRSDPDAADAVVTGMASVDVSASDYVERRERCTQRDDKRKCTRRETVRVFCTRREISLSVATRVVDERDRRVLWAGAPERSDQTSWCDDDASPASPGTVIEQLAAGIASDLRQVFAPTVRSYTVRFRERTKGLDRTQQAQFRGLVHQSQRDLPRACEGWAALERGAPDHVATVFNLGVCAEAAGDLPGALTRYERASQLLGGRNEAEDDAKRVRGLIAARELAKRRAG